MTDTPHTDEAVIEGEFVEAASAGAATSRGRRLWRWLPWALVLLLAVFIAGLFAAPSVERQLRSLGLLAPPEAAASSSGEELQRALDALGARLDALDGRLRVVETGLEGVSAEASALRLAQTTLAQRLAARKAAPAGAGGDVEAALAALSARIEKLEARLAAIAAAPAGGDAELAARVAALEDRIAALDASPVPAAAGLARHLLALDEAIKSGQPFADTLAALEAEIARLPADLRLRMQAPLESLRPYAATGVAALSSLKARFDGIAGAVIRAAAPPPEAGWWARLKDRLAGLVVIRRKGAIEGTGIAARMARAEAALERDDLAAAVAAFDGLDAAARAPADAWLAAAHRHLAARRALERLLAAGTVPRAANDGRAPQ